MANTSPSLISQISVLTYKNYKVLLGSKFTSLFYLLSPVFLCILMYHQQKISVNYLVKQANLNPNSFDITMIPKCTEKDCSTLVFGFTNGNKD